MPIIIDDKNLFNNIKTVNKAKAPNTYTPKFFDKDLTGNDKRMNGYFNTKFHSLKSMLNQAYFSLAQDSALKDISDLNALLQTTKFLNVRRNNEVFNTTDVHKINYSQQLNKWRLKNVRTLEPINPNFMNNSQSKYVLPLDTTLYGLDDLENWTIYDETDTYITRVKPIITHASVFESTLKDKNNKPVTREMPFFFHPALVMVTTIKDETQKGFAFPGYHVPEVHNVVIHDVDIEQGNNELQFTCSKLVNPQIADDVLNEFNVYQYLSELAEVFEKHAMDQVMDIANTYQLQKSMFPNEYANKEGYLFTLTNLVSSIESLEDSGAIVKTDDLNNLHQIINDMDILEQSEKNHLMQQSLRLLLSDRLQKLDEKKNNIELYAFNPSIQLVTDTLNASKDYSNKQKDIILSTEPLIIGQAGAGSGKSHTVTGRIKYLQQQGEDLEKVLVLSFTNVAAQNIIARFPEIKSKTLADMFNQIYKVTFPAQELSKPDTIINALTLIDPHNYYFTQKLGFDGDEVEQVIKDLRMSLGYFKQSFQKTDAQANMRRLLGIMMNHPEIVASVLTSVGQTTLELQQAVLYYYLANDPTRLNIPAEYQDINMIITDESQDISTFEYIMLIELTLIHNSQLLIVGDGSQTLYEFRNSDPRYLNALESSGIFKTYKLDINYRSNPEVLALANEFLKVIKANDVANIQLQANSLVPETLTSFNDKVKVAIANPTQRKRSNYNDILQDYMNLNFPFRKWLNDCIDKGEQIAFLAHTRGEVAVAEEVLNELLRKKGINKEVKNIVNHRPYTQHFISDVLIKVRDQFIKLNPNDASFDDDLNVLLSSGNKDIYSYINRGQGKNSTKWGMINLDKMKDLVHTLINDMDVQMMLHEAAAGNKPVAPIMNLIVQRMIAHETKQNNMSQVLHAQEQEDLSQYPVIVSTIHAAKGLEFDHVVINYRQSTQSTRDSKAIQEELRLFFVATSRAKTSEWIINSCKSEITNISTDLSGMFSTPMLTAYQRVEESLTPTPTQQSLALPA